MNKHTPGPWFVNHNGGGAMGRRAMLENEAGECVGYLYEASSDDENLIEAAPELLEAICGLLNALPSATTHPAIKAARAAIAKATGE